MALQFPPAPANGSQLVLDAIGSIASRTSPPPPPSVRGGGPNFQTSAAYAIYDLRADDIAAGRGLGSAHLTAFRYPVEASGQAVALADVAPDPQGNATKVSLINFGPFAAAARRALADLQAQLGADPTTYEVRALRCRAIPVIAIWLHSLDDTKVDVIYPMAPASPGLTAEKLCAPDAFVAAILPIAQQRMAPRDPNLVP